MKQTTLTPSLANAIQHELEPGEILLWQARPSRFRELWRRGWTSMVGLIVTAFATVWTIGAGGGFDDNPKSDGLGVMIVGCLFICVGIGHLLSPLWAWWTAHRTAYAVTDRRALIVTRVWNRTVRGYARSSMSQFVRAERRDGSGDLVFERITVKSGRNTVTKEIGFFGVDDVRTVQRLLLTPSAAA